MKTALRLPRSLHGRLMANAQLEGRSLNSELVQRLADSFLLPEKLADAREEIAQYRVERQSQHNEKLAEKQQVLGEGLDALREQTRLLQDAAHVRLQLADLSHLFDLFVPILVEMWEHVEAGQKEAAVYKGAMGVARSLLQDGSRTASEVAASFLNGQIEPVAAARMRAAFQLIDEAERMVWKTASERER